MLKRIRYYEDAKYTEELGLAPTARLLTAYSVFPARTFPWYGVHRLKSVYTTTC